MAEQSNLTTRIKQGADKPSNKLPDPGTIARRLKRISSLRPTLAFVLGSGFHHILSEMEVDAQIAYDKLEGFVPTTVTGHPGRLLIGKLNDTPVMILAGRSHFYEGHEMETVTFPIHALAAYGIRDLLLTNAAGGIGRHLKAGDLMLINDHINLMGVNPLRGRLADGRERFVDLTKAYDSQLGRMLKAASKKSGSKLKTGVYLAISGPSYETPAEIRAFARLGADAVGMSTVPETIAARQCGIRVAGLSCITNLAAGRAKTPLSHDEVLRRTESVKTAILQLLMSFAEIYGASIRLGIP
jgi:purine-nucleoside phosphorylase